MHRVQTFLQCTGLALCDKASRALAGELRYGEVLPEVARAAFEYGKREFVGDELRSALGLVASADPADFAEALGAALERLEMIRPLPYKNDLGAYLGLIPQTAQQVLRRPSDPVGHSLPDGFKLDRAEDLIAFLPPRLPQFHPAANPAGLDDWELSDLIGMGECGEVWSANDDAQADLSPGAFKFATDSAAAESVIANPDLFLKVFELNDIPGIVPLRSVYLECERPCLESAYVYGYDLTALINEWQWRFTTAKPEAALKLVRRLAEIVGKAHAKGIVHRDLKPSNVLLHPSEGGKFTIWLTDFGWGQIAAARSAELARGGTSRPEQARLAARGAYTPIYEAPQVSKREPPNPRDDVYSLGMIWYQLLRRDPTAEAPVGTDWAEDFLQYGMTEMQARLLSACIATRPDKRPVDANELFAYLTEAVGTATSAPRDDGSRLISLKSQSKLVAPIKPPAPPARTDDAQVYTGPHSGRQDAANSSFLTGVGTVKMTQKLGVKSGRLTPPSSSTTGPGTSLKAVRNSVGMSFALIPAGSFEMGAPDTEPGRREHDGPVHTVRITQPFYLAAYPVTQVQYEKVMGKNPSAFDRNHGGGPDQPVEMVSWHDAERFCEKLNQRHDEEVAGHSYRLPTEAEWEYACRATSTTVYPFGDTIAPENAHYAIGGAVYGKGTDRGRTTPVGQSPPNKWWLYDMIGNVSEWVSDWYDEYYYFDSPTEDPHGPTTGTLKVTRGGSWMAAGTECRSASRRPHDPNSPANFVGFRVVLIPQPPREDRETERRKAAGPNWMG